MTISINDSIQKHSLNPLKNKPIQEGKEAFGSVFEMHNDTDKLISSLQKFMNLVSQLFQTLDDSFRNENYVKKCIKNTPKGQNFDTKSYGWFSRETVWGKKWSSTVA